MSRRHYYRRQQEPVETTSRTRSQPSWAAVTFEMFDGFTWWLVLVAVATSTSHRDVGISIPI